MIGIIKNRLVGDQSGVIMVGVMIVMFFFLVVSVSIAEFAIGHYSSTRRTLFNVSAMKAADAGADHFMYQINQNSGYRGTTNAPSGTTNSCTGYTITPIELVNNVEQGRVTYESCAEPGLLTNERFVNVTAKVYKPASSTTPKSTRKLRLTIKDSNTAAGYTVQTGNGGLTLSNSSNVGSGDFYINGQLVMTNNSVIGDASGVKDSRLWVAGLGCGSGASYPQICPGTNASTLPIYLTNSAHIYADVHSPNMTGGGSAGSGTRSRMTDNGLIDGIAPALSMPDDNRAVVMGRNTWTSRQASQADCPNGQNTTTWVAGTKFTGSNINVDTNCVVTILGDVWIEGGLQLSNSASIQVGSSVTEAPNIIIDGQNGFRGSNNTSLVKNSSGVAMAVRTFWSSAGTCTATCPVPTGSALQTSQNTVTVQSSNAFSAPGTTFYAVYSGLRVDNGTNVGQLIAQKINLANSGIITFSAPQTNVGGGGTWDVRYYEVTY